MTENLERIVVYLLDRSHKAHTGGRQRAMLDVAHHVEKLAPLSWAAGKARYQAGLLPNGRITCELNDWMHGGD